MAGLIAGDSSHRAIKSGPCTDSHYSTEEPESLGSGWYFARKEIEENSPSRRDGIDLKKEAYLRKSYCTFLQDLGMRLKVPQVTIATAMVFCHRYFLHQSHAKNDRRTVATVCMFLAGKVEETPRPLKDVIIVSYEIIHKKDPSAVQKIKQKDVYEQQKELILLGERVVLTTLGFDFNVHHPYKPLVEAIKKFKVAQNSLAQVAWNFVNDGLRTSLCLQFKPHHIAAGAIFLAAKFLKVKLPSDGDRVWWQEFDVTPRQLEDVSNQMLELYEQNRPTQPSHPSEAEGSTGGGTHQAVKTISPVTESSVSQDVTAANVRHEPQVPQDLSCSKSSIEQPITTNSKDSKDETSGPRYSDAITKIDKEKVKAALEKRKKSRNDVAEKTDIIDEDDLIERELENGIEMAAEDHALSGNNSKRRVGHGYEENVEEGELSSLEEHELPSPRLQKNKRPKCDIRG